MIERSKVDVGVGRAAAGGVLLDMIPPGRKGLQARGVSISSGSRRL